jgi:hypothetical protein
MLQILTASSDGFDSLVASQILADEQTDVLLAEILRKVHDGTYIRRRKATDGLSTQGLHNLSEHNRTNLASVNESVQANKGRNCFTNAS